ncbi:MAG: acyltransferase domain-containing protein, partial [Thermoanaerobaculia bacterium]
DFDASPFYVNSELRVMEGELAGVSSFGIGGTNVHVILQCGDGLSGRRQAESPSLQLLPISARTPTALDLATSQLADHLETHPELALADVAFTLREGRRSFPHRRIVVASTREEAIAALRNRDAQRTATGAASSRPTLAFLFPGLGDHYAHMGWELYCTEPVFRETIDRCAAILGAPDIRDHLYAGKDWRNPVFERTTAEAKLDLRAMLGKKTAQTEDSPAAAQPAIFVTEYALTELLRSWGIVPDAMLGHSIGEFTAACVSGVLSLEDALRVVSARANLIQSRVARGAMLAVPLSEDELLPLLPAGISLGAINTARLCIASGEEEAIAQLAATLQERGVSAQKLRSTHAYHSQMMETLVEPLADVLRGVQLRAPKIPYVSCITGTWITDSEATDPRYWARHLCRTVRFHDGLRTLLEDENRVLFEAGPGQGLTSHALAARAPNAVIPSMRWSYGNQSESLMLLRGVGQLWIAGAPHASLAKARRVPLPTYPFERQRYWIDPPSSTTVPAIARKRTDVADWFYLPTWKPSVRPRHDGTAQGNWLLLGDAMQFADELRARGANII